MERSLSAHSLKRDSRLFCHPRVGGDLVAGQIRDSRIRSLRRIGTSGNDTKGKMLTSSIFLVILFLFSFFLMFHTFGYDMSQKNILIARTLWSDFGSHIPLIRSFSMGNNFPPQYPIFPGEPIRYHFLFYLLVGMLEKIGLRLDWALNLPSALGFTLLLWGIWTLAKNLFSDVRVAALSVLFFLFNGSLSFLQFFKLHPISGSTISDILTNTQFPSFGPWDGGVITAFWNLNIYTNQRHLAWGFALGIWFLIAITKNKYHAALWGIVLGILPYFHQPTLVIMGILMGSSFLFYPRLRLPLLISASIGLLFIAPQLLTMPKTASLSWFPGYLIHDHLSLPAFLDFWFQNVGLHAILIPLGFFLIPKHTRHILFPLVLLFAIGNLFKFSMEVTANHKFFNFAIILGNMISAYVVVWLIGRTGLLACPAPPLLRGKDVALASKQGWCWGRIGVLVGLVGLLTLSGIIDFFVILNDTKGTLADVGNNQTATWIANNTPKNAIFLNSSFLYHPASLAGRNVFLGWPYFAWSAGYDTYKRNDEMKRMYESQNPNVFCPLLQHYTISYVTVQDTKNDPNLPHIDPAYFRNHFTPIFEATDGNLRIYQTSTLCPDL